jgi:cell division protein FtsB
VAFENDGGWSKDVWDASWAEQQKEIDSLHARIKLLEAEVAWAENGYNRKPEGESK